MPSCGHWCPGVVWAGVVVVGVVAVVVDCVVVVVVAGACELLPIAASAAPPPATSPAQTVRARRNRVALIVTSFCRKGKQRPAERGV